MIIFFKIFFSTYLQILETILSRSIYKFQKQFLKTTGFSATSSIDLQELLILVCLYILIFMGSQIFAVHFQLEIHMQAVASKDYIQRSIKVESKQLAHTHDKLVYLQRQFLCLELMEEFIQYMSSSSAIDYYMSRVSVYLF